MNADGRRNVVITGVSTGIGRATAVELAAHGYHVLGSVRREEDAARLTAQIGENFTPLRLDVTDAAAIRSAADEAGRLVEGEGLAGLVNNAGIAVSGPLALLPLDEFRRQFEVTVFGTLAVTQAFLPLLRRGSRPGRIVNISSVNGRITYPFVVPYCAAKHALESLSDGLRRELRLDGIDVIVVEPSGVHTPIWDKAEQDDMAGRYGEGEYGPILAAWQEAIVARGRASLPAEKVARVVRQALEAKRPRTRYVLERNYLMAWVLPRWLPDRWFDAIIAYGLRLPGKTLSAILRTARL